MTEDITRQVLPLLELLSSAEFTEDGWPRFLQALMQTVESDVGIAVICNEQSSPIEFISEGILSVDMLGDYESHFAAIDPWANAFLSGGRPFGKNVASHELLDPKVFEMTEYYNDFWRPNEDLFYTCGALIKYAGGYANIGMPRSRSRGEYETSTIALLDILSPHISNALNLHERLKHANAARSNAEAALGKLEDAMLIVDDAGLILYANAAGEAELRSGLRVSSLRGRLIGGRLVDKNAFGMAHASATRLSALTEAIAPPSIASQESLPSSRASISFHALPSRHARHSLECQQGAALVMVCHSSENASNLAPMLRALYCLTPTESRIAQGLLVGKSLDELAAELSMKRETIRVHLKHIFAKTGVKRQGQLVSLLQGVRPRVNLDSAN
ncbi:MAG: helix-turn-helix transcriptional regulator [Dokdonella sp.]